MITKSRTAAVLARVLFYFVLGVAIWFKLRAGQSSQLTVAGVLLLLGVLALNYYAAKVLWNVTKFPSRNEAVLTARSTTILVLILGLVAIGLSDGAIVRGAIRTHGNIRLSEATFGAAWLAGLIGLLLVYGGAYELRTTPDTVNYSTLFGGFRSLSWDQIRHARIRHGWFSYSDRFRPTNRLEILPGATTNMLPIIVNLNAFKKADIDKLLEWLGEKLHEEGQGESNR
jgi:hypothetical protein